MTIKFKLIKESITSKDSLIDQLTRIMDFIHKHTNKAYIITGNPKREERWDYPMDAIREMVAASDAPLKHL